MRLSSLSRGIALAMVVLGVCGPAAAEPPARAPRPNIVFILIDDMGWRDLGCYGSTFYRTPNIDRIARTGLRFTNGYAACPVCSPTRASILTGKYPARLHLTDWLPGRADRSSQKLLRPKIRMHLPLEEVTLAAALKPNGRLLLGVGEGAPLGVLQPVRGLPGAYEAAQRIRDAA